MGYLAVEWSSSSQLIFSPPSDEMSILLTLSLSKLLSVLRSRGNDSEYIFVLLSYEQLSNHSHLD